MGCTSSAPNMVDSQTDTTGNLENFEVYKEETSEKGNGNELSCKGHQDLEQKQVFPECENKKQLSNNIAPADDHNSREMDKKDSQSHPIESESIDNVVNKTDFLLGDEKLISLKEVVEKVISENNEEDDQKIYSIDEVHDVDRQIEEIMELKDSDDTNEIESKDVEDNESTSPTQSEDSRATRWEALADIAAELPPSLAVDPLTGQIYSLTK